MSDTTPTFDVAAIRKQAREQLTVLPPRIKEAQKRRDELNAEIKKMKADLAAAKVYAGRDKGATT